MKQESDEVAILVMTHDNFEMTKYFISNLIRNTSGKYRLHIFDYKSTDAKLIEDLRQTCKDQEWFFKAITADISISDVYNQMLETVYQKYAVFMPINVIVNRNWLRDLKYYYTSIKNSGCVSIKSYEDKLKLTSALFENLQEPEDEMRVVWVNSTSILNDFIFFERSRIEQVGRFDKILKHRGLEIAEFSFRFLGHGWLNYYVTKNNCIRVNVEDDILFPKITKEAKQELKTQIEIMVKVKQFKK